jgi:hypothetical protein
LHPFTLGCEVVAKNALGSLTKLVTMTKERFQYLFLVVIGGGVAFLLYLIFVTRTLALSNLACWQLNVLLIVFPLIASL